MAKKQAKQEETAAQKKEGLRQWHRYFGLAWMDTLIRMPVQIEIEKDLAIRKQLLDLVIIYLDESTKLPNLPDGFEQMTRHNLLSFKSYQESLDGSALCELVAHAVNYRKCIQAESDEDEEEESQLAEDQFGRYMVVVVRTPHNRK